MKSIKAVHRPAGVPRGAERWSSGTSSLISTDGTLRTYNYTARVMQNQTTPPWGIYNDTLLIDLAFSCLIAF
ncbi:hypothetical protein DXF93_22405 [Escherichia coli]|nr:hypothetical protein DXF93_22405 [Escherichia coli]